MTNLPDWSIASAAILEAALMEQWRRDPRRASLWAPAFRRFNGQPMELPKALVSIYDDEHPLIVVQKPAQVGVSECNVNVALHSAAMMLGGRGHVGYFGPTQQVVDRLSQDRLTQAIALSRPLRALMSETEGTRGPQRMQMRQVGKGLVYLVGTEQPSQYTGLDLDLVILDEYDLMKDEVFSNAQARLRSSRDPRMRVVSTPTIPEWGINALIAQSDERHYELNCTACGAWIEPQFPEHVDFKSGSVVCRCGAPLSHDAPGRWVARRPEVTTIRGYVLSRLVLPNLPLAAMRLASTGSIPMSVEEFWRQDLGMPWLAENARLGPADLNAAIAEPPPLAKIPGQGAVVVMGVDVGQHDFWVVIRVFFGKRSFIAAVRHLYGDWNEIAQMCTDFHVNWVAVDAQPDTRGAERFLDMVRHQVALGFMVYYSRERDHDYQVAVYSKIMAARTLAFDELFDGVRRKTITMPPDVMGIFNGEYANHMQALVRTTEPDDFGQPIAAYKHTRPDHLAHAEAYISLIARRYGRFHGFAE